MGMAKIDPNKKIVKDAARQVTFSKRRTGLFKKAFELSVLCELELAIVVFSQKGKVFSFAHPEIDYVISRYRNSEDVKPFDGQRLQDIYARVEELIPRYNQAIEQSKIGKERNLLLKELHLRLAQKIWAQLNTESMTLQQLQIESDELQKLVDFNNIAYQQQQQQQQMYGPPGAFMEPGGDSQMQIQHMHPPPPRLLPALDPAPQQWYNMSMVENHGVMPGVMANIRSMAWPPTANTDYVYRNQSFPTRYEAKAYESANIAFECRPSVGSQNAIYSAVEPMPLQIYHGQQPIHLAGVDADDTLHLQRPGTYSDQQHMQQAELIAGGDQMIDCYPPQTYVQQYDPIHQQNQQSRYSENMQIARPYNELNTYYNSFSPPREQQFHSGMNNSTQLQAQHYPYNSGTDQMLDHQERGFAEGSSQTAQRLAFNLPYDPFHVSMLPGAPTIYTNRGNVGTIIAPASAPSHAPPSHAPVAKTPLALAGDGRGVNAGSSSQPSDEGSDSSESLKDKPTHPSAGPAPGQHATYTMHDSEKLEAHDSHFTP